MHFSLQKISFFICSLNSIKFANKKMNYNLICDKAIIIAKNAAEYIRNERNKFKSSDVEIKGLHDYVTYVDKQAERIIVSGLKEIIENAAYLTEEKTEIETQNEFKWIIDPLDGTTNFIHDIPYFSISIALLHDDKLVIGIIYDIIHDEAFYAFKNGGAYLNAKKIKVSETKNLDESLLATGFPYYDYQQIDEYINFFKFTMQKTRGIRRLGSAALDLAWVACGRFDGFYEYGLRPWDVAAKIIIVEEAGGKVSDFSGGDNMLFGKEIITTNSNIYSEFLSQLKVHFNKK